MIDNDLSGGVLPMGLFMSLSMRHDAMEEYLALDDEQKHTVRAKSRNVTSREEMEELVRMVAEGKFE